VPRAPIVEAVRRSWLDMIRVLLTISIGSVAWAIVTAILMWGILYLGYGAVFPSFYPELFPTRTRVSAMAVSQNIGTMITAALPAVFAALDLDWTPAVDQRIRSWREANPKGKRGTHEYQLDDYGLDRATVAEAFASYTERFDIPSEDARDR